MFVIIHGEDRVKTRQELFQLVQASSDIVTLDGNKITLEAIIQNIESASLFGTSARFTIIENLHRLKSKTDLKEIIAYLSSQKATDISLILWENQELTKAQLNKFPTAQVITKKISPSIFALTDAISPETSTEKRISLCDKALEENAPEMIAVMLARHLRLMITTFDPHAFWPPNMTWQKTKLTKIANQFGFERLISLHHQLALIDVQSKTGSLAGNLNSRLTVWMATLSNN